MLLKGAVAPSPGTYVEIIGPEASIAGQVIWSRDDRFGVRTRERLNVRATATELRSLRLTSNELASAPFVTSKTVRADTGSGTDLSFRAERSRMSGRRFEQVVVAATAVIAGVVVAATAYHTLARPLVAVTAGASLHR
jgi:hypothetical protein